METRFRYLRGLLIVGLVAALAAPVMPTAGASHQAEGAPVKGKHQAFRGKLFLKRPGKIYPSNKPVSYNGPKLKVQAVPVGREAAEPTVAVLNDGSAFFAAGTFDGPPYAGSTRLARTEIFASFDGGVKWESVQSEIAGQDESPQTLDPYVYADPVGGRVFSVDLYTVSGSYLLWTDDKGKTWSRNPLASAGWSVDHQTLYSGPPPEGVETDGYPSVLYYCTNWVAKASCSRSMDGGVVWNPTGEPAFYGEDPGAGGFCGGLHGHAEVDSKGRLFLPKGHCQRPWVAMSEDMGESWTRVQAAKYPRTAGPHIEIATDSEDNVYLVWWSRRRQLPFLVISKDHGKTWTKPRLIAPPGVKHTNFPVIAAGDRGRIAVLFPGTTQEKEDGLRPWNDYIVMSTNALSKNPLFVSTTINPIKDPVHRGNCNGRCGGMFDFLDLFVSPHDGSLWGAASDTCVAECVNGIPQPKRVGDGVAVKQISGPSLWAPGHEPPKDN